MKDADIKYYQQKMSIMDNGSIYYLKYCEINYISYIRPYIHIFTIFDKEILINYSLLKFITNLPDLFFTCNKSTIINIAHLKSLCKNGTFFFVLLENDKKIKVSRRKVCKIKNLLTKIDGDFLNCEVCILKNKKTGNETL